MAAAAVDRANSAASPGRSASAPNAFRPERIGLAAGDDVDARLRHHVAERGDVDLVASRHCFQRARRARWSDDEDVGIEQDKQRNEAAHEQAEDDLHERFPPSGSQFVQSGPKT